MKPVKYDGGIPHWLHTIARSAAVKRYHTEDTIKVQSVGEHTYGVFWMAHLLCGERGMSPGLTLNLMAHDLPEHVTGDVPGPTKLQQGVGASMELLENAALKELGLHLPALTDEEARILKMADCLEGALWCLRELQRGNRHIRQCLENYISYIADRLFHWERGTFVPTYPEETWSLRATEIYTYIYEEFENEQPQEV